MKTELEKSPVKIIADMIRRTSERGKLLSEDEIIGDLQTQGVSPDGHPGEDFPGLIRNAVAGEGDLREVTATDGSRRYFSSRSMAEAYAALLLKREGDPLEAIAEAVRENSALYPRPVPLDLFTRPPFEIPLPEILSHVEMMANKEAFRDIVSTTTSASRVYLFSTLHLDPDYGSMLAEWLDVGQFENP